MSYILDALRRAQAERSRGSVPRLDTPAFSTGDFSASPSGPRASALWLLVAGGLLAVVLAGMWFLKGLQPVEQAAVAPPLPEPVVHAQEKAPPQPTPEIPPEPPASTVESSPQQKEIPKLPAPPKKEAAPKTAAKPAPPPILALADLPPAVRNQLPSLQLAGLTYSSNPQHRMVIVNGQILHEGDTAAPDVVLERIEAGQTIWRFQEWRYAVPLP